MLQKILSTASAFSLIIALSQSVSGIEYVTHIDYPISLIKTAGNHAVCQVNSGSDATTMPLLITLQHKEGNTFEVKPWSANDFQISTASIQGNFLYAVLHTISDHKQELRIYPLDDVNFSHPLQTVSTTDYLISTGEKWVFMNQTLYQRNSDGTIKSIAALSEKRSISFHISGDKAYGFTNVDKITEFSLSNTGMTQSRVFPLAFPPTGNYSMCTPMISDMNCINGTLDIAASYICYDVLDNPTNDVYPVDAINHYQDTIFPRGAVVLIDVNKNEPNAIYPDVNLGTLAFPFDSAQKIRSYKNLKITLQNYQIRIWYRWNDELRFIEIVKKNGESLYGTNFDIMENYLLVSSGMSGLNIYNLDSINAGMIGSGEMK